MEMLNANLKKKEGKTVFFNAWKQDFGKQDFAVDPLVVFLGEINKELKELACNNEKRKEIEKVKGILIQSASQLIQSQTGIDFGKLIKNFSENDKEVNKFKENIKKLINDISGTNGKLYIFIDELDRCRPTYSIELLERIKHLLEIEGLVFILAMDKKQLSHSIKNIYGNKFDALGYLRRFIDIEHVMPNIPQNNWESFIDHLYHEFELDDFFKKRKQYEDFRDDGEDLRNVFATLASSKQLSLREVEQLFSKINLVRLTMEKNMYLHPELLAFLIIAKEFNNKTYSDYIKGNTTHEKMIELLHKIVPKDVLFNLKSGCYRIEAYLVIAECNKYTDTEKYLIQHKERYENKLNEFNKESKQWWYYQKIYEALKSLGHPRQWSIQLEFLVQRIEMLENFNFNDNENKSKKP